MNNKLFTLALAIAATTTFATVANAQLVTEAFDGPNAPSQVTLNGSSADTFAPAIVTAGGSATWIAPNNLNFTTSGAVRVSANSSAYLNLGSYINDTKGTAAGKFVFSVTLANTPSVSSEWLGIAIFGASPVTNQNFTAADGTAALIYRGSSDVDAFVNGASGRPEDGNTITGEQTLTMTLDLTTEGGYNGTNNFGTISFAAGVTSISSYTYTNDADANFQYIGLTQSAATTSDGYYSDLSLVQIPEPSSFALIGGGLALTSVMLRRRRD